MMKVIRDEEMGGLMMIPLFTQYGLPFALCDSHYFEAKEKGKIECTLDF